MNKYLKPLLTAVFVSAFVSVDANAASVIDAAITGQLTDTNADQAIVGAFIITLSVTALSYRWIKGMLFG